ncbi:PxKF domain-containing protein [Nannocystis pusilla]|uniref:PxKF domain-containing protein n=2 Tax=Nannocystis pusilla TaxID=889268 RepID=A0ABS7TW28_9BACT|nr:PxKF domain-containing protein [Nannocystis pusilla]MBZ5712470.1 PxKF domain-containing protein [Nannocystis pusilla]
MQYLQQCTRLLASFQVTASSRSRWVGRASLRSRCSPGSRRPRRAGLQYDALTDTYPDVWRTQKRWKNTCRVLILSLDDGTEHLAYFKFTK